jgi:hypothetical protein
MREPPLQEEEEGGREGWREGWREGGEGAYLAKFSWISGSSCVSHPCRKGKESSVSARGRRRAGGRKGGRRERREEAER